MSAVQIRRQIEYYFGNYNLSRDAFLKTELAKAEDASVPLELINTTFPRMKALGVTLDAIRAACADSDVVTVTDDLRIRRREPVPADYSPTPLSIYVKNLPRDLDLAAIQDIIRHYEPALDHVSMRHDPKTKAFKGSCIAVFRTADAADAFFKRFGEQAAEDSTRPAAEYYASDAYAKSKEAGLATDPAFLERLPDILIVLRLDTWARAPRTGKPEGAGARTGADQPSRKTFVQGLILKVFGLGSTGYDAETGKPQADFAPASDAQGDQMVTRALLRSVFEKYGTVKFVEYADAAMAAFIRYDISCVDAAKKACEDTAEKGLALGGAPVTLSVLEGDEEQEFWKKILRTDNRGRNRGGRRYQKK